ncbi:MAG: ATP-dependent DNA helicase [Patescibacteria group bacterium]
MNDSVAYLEGYKKLNEAQKLAVDTVEGPVLVVAGPGTGKTHILTLRIANILRQTQATPTNILVLTFTESAARTVRTRLAGLVGDTVARDVGIYTFHGFCDYVLKNWADYFPSWNTKRLAGDVEAALLWREVIEHAQVVHLRPPKSPFMYLHELSRLYGDLTRERVTLEQYLAWAREEEDRIKADEGNYYTRDSKYGKKGDFKPDGTKKLERLEKVYEAVALFEAYEERKDREGVYDFNDVLRGVVDALQSDEALCAALQEQYQYVLADEHQDANAYQHALLDSFAFDEHPNLFVVGDEKQAIYRFQGADSTHFREFMEKYPRATLVTLTESFRSLSGILDAAHNAALGHIPASHGAHKPLSATRAGEAKMTLLAAPDPLAERDQVAGLVEQLLADGVAPHEIAVIAARNSTVSLFATHLAGRGIATLRAGNISLSSRPLIRSLLSLMRAAANPLDTAALREVVLAPWWEAGLAERSTFLLRTRDKDLQRALLEQFPKIGEVVQDPQGYAQTEGPLSVFSRLLVLSGARAFLLSHVNHIEDVALVRRLYEYLEEIVARDQNISFADAVLALTRAREHGLEWVKSSATTKEGCVTVITAHKAKGMEFEHVFIVGLTENEWEKGKMAAKIPSPVDMSKNVEDAAKQFYVALTRAKDAVVLSYAAETLEGRERKPSVFIPAGLNILAPASDPLPVLHADVHAPELIVRLTREYLSGEGLSPSALADYLESPATFFARRVLHLKEPEQARMLIGTAVHAGIAALMAEDGTQDAAYGALAATLHRSLMPRTSAFDQAGEDARARLAAFAEVRAQFGTATAIEKTYRAVRTVAGEEVHLSGKLDAVLERDGRKTIVDFKTSSTVKEADPKFALQLAFYDYLLRQNGETPHGVSIIQVRTDGVDEVPIPLGAEVHTQFEVDLDAALSEMLTGRWRPAKEASEYDDLLALFA